ncbi:WYL domain-containing protein [bacterium]|nr:WYL domain-containing protein [bacterium]
MDEDKLLKLTPEECFLLLTGARLFDRLVAGVTIHAEQKDELIKEIIAKLVDLVPEQLESMSDELADAIVESVLGCDDLEDTELEELELAFLDTDIELNEGFFADQNVRQLSIDGLELEDEILGSPREFFQNENPWPPFEEDENPLEFDLPRSGKKRYRRRETNFNFSQTSESEDDLIPPSSDGAEKASGQRRNAKINEQLEKYLVEETFSYPMYPVEQKLPQLEKALLKHLSIQVDYYSVARETVDRINLDPLVILQEDGMWLVVAFCHERDDVLLFRADRMKDIEETGARFETPRDINQLRCKALVAYK